MESRVAGFTKRVFACAALAIASAASGAPIYTSAEYSGGLNSVTSSMKARLTAAGYDASLFNCSTCAGATEVGGHVIYDASVPIPGGIVNVFSIDAIPTVADELIFELEIGDLTFNFGDAGIQGGPAIRYNNGVSAGFFFVEDFNSPNQTLLRLSAQGSTFSLARLSDRAILFTGFLGGLTNLQPFDPTNPLPPNPVPEPATLALFGIALAGLALRRRRVAG